MSGANNRHDKSKRAAQSKLHSFFPKKKQYPNVEMRTSLVEPSDQVERIETFSTNLDDYEIRPELNISLNIPVDDVSTELSVGASASQNCIDKESETPSTSTQNIDKGRRSCAVLPDTVEGARQPHLPKYPLTKFGTKNRCFSSKWYNGRPWLSYDIKLDACFCAVCVQFADTGNKGTFITVGYRDWKHALDTSTHGEYKKGFGKHECSREHINACKLYVEKVNRERKNKKIETLVLKPVADHIVWLDTVFTVVKYLGINGLPFRGHTENTDFISESFGGGLYLNTYADLGFKLNPELHEFAKRLPSNAKYTSPDVQNEAAEIISEIVKETIAKRVQDSKLYTIMVDGSTNKNGEEVIGLVVRYIHNSVICENVLNIGTVQDRSTKGLLEFIVATFEKYGVDKGGAVSQAYDGASVMSGKFNGVKVQFSVCDRLVIYIHCYCHRLHLTVIAVLESIPDLADHFAIVSSIYNFCTLHKVKKMYTGTSLHRLITTRWSGHDFAVSALEGNQRKSLQLSKIVQLRDNWIHQNV